MRRTPEAARENILAAAEGLLVSQGPRALKLVDVAEAAGIANASVLHHFGSIENVQAALMERMIRQLVETILAADIPQDATAAHTAALQALFDAFESRGAARLAAWLELTDESRRLTVVRQAVEQVVANRLERFGAQRDQLEEFVLAAICLALGVGLFGPTLGQLLGRPEGEARRTGMLLLQGALSVLIAGRPAG